jgi:cell division protein FtsI/penicillin-binding protein 2
MDATTGKILSMVGYDKTDPRNNPCTDNRFPAASVFKIITAAAALEACGFDPSSTFTYNGRKYTLYKYQLKDRENRYTRKITLRDSFAQSINPVFGKIGSRDLGKPTLEKYAEAFGFNRHIDSEFPISPSSVSISDEPYELAEIACGFNRETTLSPLHGVLMAAAILNDGKMIAPAIVEKVADENGRILYQSHLTELNQVISPDASQDILELMQATVQSGTSKKAFRGYRKDRILSKLIIGGKTGSIFNKPRDARIDWFVGFAKEKQGTEKLAISVVVAHEKYIGIRASRYARMAIQHYFKNYYLKDMATSDKAQEAS